MKQAFVSILALVLMTAAFAVPARANGSIQGRTFALFVDGFPEATRAGETLSGTITVAAFGDPGRTFRGEFEISIVTPLGDAPIRSGKLRIAGNTKTSATLSLPVAADAKPGDYTLRIVVTIGRETLTLEHVVTVT